MKKFLLMGAMMALLLATLGGPALAQYDDDDAELDIEKVSADGGVEGEFTFTIACDGLGEEQVSVAVGETAADVVPGLQDGMTCLVTEEDVDEADAPFWTFDGGGLDVQDDPREVEITVEATGTVTLTADNPEGEVLSAGDLLVSKDLELLEDAELADYEDLLFEFVVQCGDRDVRNVELTAGDDPFQEINLEAGTECLIQEVASHGADPISISVSGEDGGDRTVDGDEVTVTIPEVDEGEEGPVEVSVVFTNTFEEEEEVLPSPTPTPTPVPEPEPEPDEEVLASTGFEVSWAALLAMGLLLPGGAALYVARRKDGRVNR